METMNAIALRQSCRAYTNEQILDSELETVLKAANAAPIGMGKYDEVKLTVIQNKNLLDKINMVGVEASGDPSRRPTYDAPTVILVSMKSETGFATEGNGSNAACVIENMSIAAVDLGLGHVYLRGIIVTLAQKKDMYAELKIPEGFLPIGAIALGKSANAQSPRELTTSKIATDYVK